MTLNDYPSVAQMFPAVLAFLSSAMTLAVTRYIDAKNREKREKNIEEFRQAKNKNELSSLVNLQIKDILIASEAYREEVRSDMENLKKEIHLTKDIHEKKMADIIASYENQIEDLRKRINVMAKIIDELRSENELLKKKKSLSNTPIADRSKNL